MSENKVRKLIELCGMRWTLAKTKTYIKFTGVMRSLIWELWQPDENYLEYKVSGEDITINDEDCEEMLQQYFRLHINLGECYAQWKSSHWHFMEASNKFKAVRILDQEPFENLISFICSQNNNIKRISNMVEFLCSSYGEKLGVVENKTYYSFPTLNALRNIPKLAEHLRLAKFGYRAKYIEGAVKTIEDLGGVKWLENLKKVPYEKAKMELLSVPGVGPKVADCICLMSLDHLEAVPVDTHIFKTAKKYYFPEMKEKTVTQKLYSKIADKFREIYGNKAGWAQAVLFCTQLSLLTSDNAENDGK